MSGFDIQRLFATAPMAFGAQATANPFASQQTVNLLPAYVIPMASNYNTGDAVQVQSFLQDPPVPMPMVPGQSTIPMPTVPGQPTIPMPTVPGQTTMPMPYPNNVISMPGYPSPGVPQPNNFPNPWAAANSVYGIPISGSVAQTMTECNQMTAQAGQIMQDGLADAARAQARRDAEAATGKAAQQSSGSESSAMPELKYTEDGKLIMTEELKKWLSENNAPKEAPSGAVDETTGEDIELTSDQKDKIQELLDAKTKAKEAAEKKANPSAETIAEEKKEASVKALEILAALGHDGKVQNSDFEAALKSPEAANNPEIKEAIEFIKEHSKTLAGTRGDENDHVTYEELGFIASKMKNGSWKSLDQALDYSAERKLFKLIMKNNEEEDGFTWGFADSNLQLDGDDYDELVKAIGDDDVVKEKLDELKNKFEDFKHAAGVGNNQSFWKGLVRPEYDNPLNWTDGNEMTKKFCENMFTAIDRGWSMQQVLDKKDLDSLLKTSPENWDASPKEDDEAKDKEKEKVDTGH